MAVESRFPLKEESLHQIQTFSEFMADFLIRIQAREVVEIGSDSQLKLALNLAPCCERFYSVNFPEDCIRMEGWYKLHQEMGGIRNLELVSGNALRLSELIHQADVIILQNVLLALTREDMDLMWKYRRGELECSDEQWAELISKFDRAEEEGFREFLKVAKPGYIIVFKKVNPDRNFMDFLVDKLKIDPNRIEQKELLRDNSEDIQGAWIINNTF